MFGAYDFFVGVVAAKVVLGALWLSPRLRDTALLMAAGAICVVLAREGTGGLVGLEHAALNALALKADLAKGLVAGALLVAVARFVFHGRVAL